MNDSLSSELPKGSKDPDGPSSSAADGAGGSCDAGVMKAAAAPSAADDAGGGGMELPPPPMPPPPPPQAVPEPKNPPKVKARPRPRRYGQGHALAAGSRQQQQVVDVDAYEAKKDAAEKDESWGPKWPAPELMKSTTWKPPWQTSADGQCHGQWQPSDGQWQPSDGQWQPSGTWHDADGSWQATASMSQTWQSDGWSAILGCILCIVKFATIYIYICFLKDTAVIQQIYIYIYTLFRAANQ